MAQNYDYKCRDCYYENSKNANFCGRCGSQLFSNAANHEPNPMMHELQQMQMNYDDKYWNHHGEFEKVRHILLHLNKLTGKLATYCEAKEHGEEHEIIAEIKQNAPADLLIYALQLANLFGQNLADMRDKRIDANIKKHQSKDDE